jgi:hypothetical protein
MQMNETEKAIEKYKGYLEEYKENEVSTNERNRWKLVIEALEKQGQSK